MVFPDQTNKSAPDRRLLFIGPKRPIRVQPLLGTDVATVGITAGQTSPNTSLNTPSRPEIMYRPAHMTCTIFKASALWAHAFYKSKCPCVGLFVCSLFEVPFKGIPKLKTNFEPLKHVNI